MSRGDVPGTSRSGFDTADGRNRGGGSQPFAQAGRARDPAIEGTLIDAKAAPVVLPVTLIPDSAIQFFDFTLAHEGVAAKLNRYFEEDDGGEPALYSAELDGDMLYHPLTGDSADVSQTFAISGEQALEPYLDLWLPVPILRHHAAASGPDELEEGPTNWARVFISRSAASSHESAYRVVLALDTSCDTRPAGEARSYPAPTLEDARAGAAFRFTSDEGAVAAFVGEAWVDDWLRDAVREHRQRQAAVQAPGQPALEYLARYLTLLQVLEAARIPEIRLAPPHAERGSVGVDLVLDIGHTRTLALLRPHNPAPAAGQPPTTPRSARALPIRDLTEPWRVHEGHFASRVEFAAPSFGKEALSRLSDRSNAFFWPSLVRVGSEAERLAAARPTTDDLTGSTSPMRYLWDEEPATAAWRFVKGPQGSTQRGGLVAGPQLALLPGDGARGEDEDDDAHAAGLVRPRFARSSLMTFLVAEVLAHAMVAINAPGMRGRGPRSHLPRRIERILVTVPAGLLEREREILRRRVAEAVHIVWQMPSWGNSRPTRQRARPEIRFVHDNASNAMLAFLYNEIGAKFRGRAADYFQLAGRQRPEYRSGRSLRIAAIDIGGGATGVSIATFHAAEGAPAIGTLDVGDGARVGGDDVAKAVAERHVIPALVRALEGCKLPDARSFLAEILGGRVKGRPAWLGGFGRRFARDFAYPLAIALVKAHAEAGDMAGDVASRHTVGSLLTRAGMTQRTVADELDDLAAEEGAIGFSCQAVPISFLVEDFNATIMGVLGPLLANAVHLVEALDCDTVLLSGATSQIPAIMDALIEAMPARAGRIVQLAEYGVGDWCPLRSPSGRLADAKSLTAMGALVAADDTHSSAMLRLSPRVAEEPLMIGRLDADGLVRNSAVLFTLGHSREDRSHGERVASLAAETPCVLGARRMPLESWPAVPYWVADVEAQLLKGRLKQPLRLTIERVMEPDSDRENLILVKALDAEGATLAPRDVTFRFQTLAAAKGYWLDAGTIGLE